jgi:hypothetical protein
MLISHHKKFIFIHVPKSAGTSIRSALSPFCYANKITSLKNKLLKKKPIESNNFDHHIKVDELKAKLPANIFNQYFKFGIVRNPFDRQVSTYHFIQQNKEHFQNELVKKMSFEDYVVWRVEKGMNYQKDFLFDSQGNQLVDFVGRIENINQDFQYICDKIGVKNELKHVNKSIHKDYRKMYTGSTFELINKAYAEEIELFGYDFDGIKNLDK